MKKSAGMKYKYNIFILGQVILIAITPLLFWLSLENPALVFTRTAIIIVWVAQILFLFYTLMTSDRDLDRFVKIITNEEDYHLLSKGGWLRPHSQVLVEINAVIESFRNLKAQKESDLLFFKLVMEYTPVGIMAVSAANRIVLINRAAKELFEVGDLAELDHLDRKKEGLAYWFRSLEPGNASVLSIDSPSRSLYLSVVATCMKIREENIILYSVKDIKNEIDSREMETLQRMMRLLSHEVVNSISPISLLAANINKSIAEFSAGNKLNPSDTASMADIELGLLTIHKRSNDLNHFVGSIRTLTTIPEPRLECVRIDYLVQQSAGLMKSQLTDNKIRLITEVGDTMISCDPRLVIQVLINLVKNSMEAMAGMKGGLLRISAQETEEKTVIRLEDNGPGITGSIRDEIFSPFFTTKEKGSGIGLSFSKQVMSLHKGEINLWSRDGQTVFSLIFPVVNCV